MVCQCTLNLLGYSALALIGYRILTALYNILFPILNGKMGTLAHSIAATSSVRPLTCRRRQAPGGLSSPERQMASVRRTQLAKTKFNVFLISRTQSKLDVTKKEIEAAAPGVEIRTFAFDFVTSTKASYEPLVNELEKIEIGILVNNVGMSFEYPEVLHATVGGLQRLADMTTVNCLPTVLLSAVALKQMSERRTGIIINIASFAAYNEMSHWNVYSATKRFVLHLSGILRAEYAPAGVIVQAIAPLIVATNMSKIRRASFFGPFADAFVAQALRTVGLVDETTGYFAHQIQLELMRLMPRFLRDAILNSATTTIRAGAVKKLAKAQ